MGARSSKTQPSAIAEENAAISVKWRVKPTSKLAIKHYQEDGTLSSTNIDGDHLELRLMLDDPIAKLAIERFAGFGNETYFLCWIDIQEFKSCGTEHQKVKAQQIYRSYLDSQSTLFFGELLRDEIDKIQILLNSVEADARLSPSLFDEIQSFCFDNIYDLIYLPFKGSKQYRQLSEQLNTSYNRVQLSDFEYYSKLGEGGFGFVVHCKKKSTGKTVCSH